MTTPSSDQSSHVYDGLFYKYQRKGSKHSAFGILQHLIGPLGPRNVLDVGGGATACVAVYRKMGVEDVLGVGGDYVDRSMVMIDSEQLRPEGHHQTVRLRTPVRSCPLS